MAIIQGELALVGREHELGELTAALDAAVTGNGRIVMLAGEPGIGKTRLAEELSAHAREGERVQVLWGRCPDERGAPPFWPWIQLIRSYASASENGQLEQVLGAGAGEIAALVPEVRERIPDLNEPPDSADPEQARFRLFDAFATFLRRVSAKRPLLIILEDLQWADTASLRLLEFVVPEISTSALMFLGTYRDGQFSRRHPLTETLGSIGTARSFRRVTLRGLPDPDVRQLVAAVSGVQPTEAMAREIRDRTDGNPFFVSEVARDFGSAAVIGNDDGERRTGLPAFRIPEGVHEAIGRRLNRLSDVTNDALTAAALVGREFSIDQLRLALSDVAPVDLFDAIDEATGAQLIEELPGDTPGYRFVHALVAETLTSDLTATQRARLSARVAEALEASYGDNADAHAIELAHQFTEAEAVLGTDKVIHYSRVAGDQALASHGFDEAIPHYERAYAALSRSDMTDEAAEILSNLGRAQAATERLDEAARSLTRAFEYHVDKKDDERAVAVIGTVHSVEMGVLMADVTRRALELASESSPHRARLLASYGFIVGVSSLDYETARQALDEALVMAQQEKDVALQMRTLAYRANVDSFHLFWESCSEMSAEAVTLEREVDDPVASLRARVHGINAAMALGNLDVGRELCEQARSLAERFRDRLWRDRVLAHLSSIAYLSCDWDMAAGIIEDPDIREIPTSTMFRYGYPVLFALAIQLGRTDEAESIRKRYGAAWGTMNAQQSAAAAIAARLTGDRVPEVPSDLPASQYREHLGTDEVPLYQLSLTIAQALSAIVNDNRSVALAKYGALMPHAGKIALWPPVSVDRLLGLLAHATRLGPATSAGHFQSALSFCRAAGYQLELAWTCSDYADMLLDRDDPGDRETAIALQDEALTITREKGIKPLTERILARQENLRA